MADTTQIDGEVSTFSLTLLNDADAATMRTTLGLVIGTNVQAEDAGLTSIAGLTTAANTLIYTTALDTYAVIASANDSVLITSAGGVPSLSQAIPDGVTATTQSASDNSTKLATTAYVDSATGGGSGANAALSNLAAVAINTTLVSDTDITDDVGTSAIRWNNIYGATLRTGDTAADTLLLQAYDVDGTSWVTFATLTAGNTPTMALSGDITGVTQSASDNSTKLATTAYVDSAVTGGGSGKILQVVSASATATQTVTAGTFTDVTSITVSITPASTSNKILIMASISDGSNGASSNIATYKLLRDSTDISIGDASSSRTRSSFSAGAYAQNQMSSASIVHVDSPATVSSVTYKVQVYDLSGTAYINRTAQDTDAATYARQASNIIAMEIDGT